MKHEPTVQGGYAISILNRIRSEYAELVASGTTLSLNDLLSPDQSSLDRFCEGFSPHPQSADLRREAEIFGERYGTWLANSKYYIDCAFFLYPCADFERLLTIVRNLSIGFYMNDVMGRDVFKFLSQEQKSESREMIQRMANVDESLSIPPNAHPLEVANIEVLREFKNNSPAEWFLRFLTVYCHHIEITHRDGNAKALGHIPTIAEYIVHRCYYAGVHHVTMWIEYSTGVFLQRDQTEIFSAFDRLHDTISKLAALLNDLFSFEVEVIDNNCDSNLVMILVLNDSSLTLKEAIGLASGIVQDLFILAMDLIRVCEQEITRIKAVDPGMADILLVHLNSLIRCTQAIWLWHVDSKRYKRSKSIWKETNLPQKAMKGAA